MAESGNVRHPTLWGMDARPRYQGARKLAITGNWKMSALMIRLSHVGVQSLEDPCEMRKKDAAVDYRPIAAEAAHAIAAGRGVQQSEAATNGEIEASERKAAPWPQSLWPARYSRGSSTAAALAEDIAAAKGCQIGRGQASRQNTYGLRT